MKLASLQERLSSLAPEQMDEQVKLLDDDDLIELMNSRLIMLGDIATEIVASRGNVEKVIDAIRTKRLRTVNGRLRGTFILNCCGLRIPGGYNTYLELICEKNVDILSNILFGLAFLQDKRAIPAIELALAQSSGDPERRKWIDRALLALREGNPSAFAPGFVDTGNVWGLK